MKRALIVLNGRSPGRRLLKSLTQGADLIAAADGGAQALLDAGIGFHAIVGDIDSFDPKKVAKKKVEIVQEQGQEDTDFEKTLRWILRTSDARDIIFTAGMSDEFDHVLTHLSIASKYARRAKIRQVEDSAVIYFVTERLELDLKLGTKISLVALGLAEGVKTHGLKWPLLGEDLQMGLRDGLHNEVSQRHVTIDVRDGCLAVILNKTKGEAFRW